MKMKRWMRSVGAVCALGMLTACGGGGGGGSTQQTVTLSGTVPGTLIEAFGDNGFYTKTTSTDNGTGQHPFTLEVPADIGFQMVMTMNENQANAISIPIRFNAIDGNSTQSRLRLSKGNDLALGHIDLSQAVDLDGDSLSDAPLDLTFADSAKHPLRLSDLDGDGTVDQLDTNTVSTSNQDPDNDGWPNSYDPDDDGDSILDENDSDHLSSAQDADGDGIHDESDADPHNDDDSDDRYDSSLDHDHDGYIDDEDHDYTTGTSNGDSTAPITRSSHLVLASNDLGMHCLDKDYSVFSLLPPYNVVNAQVVERGLRPKILSSSEASVSYSATTDSTGSINRTSSDKVNFWTHAEALFGQQLSDEVGLSGQRMPGNGSEDFQQYDSTHKWFTAAGIPITPYDDAGNTNAYPVLKVQAKSTNGQSLAEADVVLPVSDETDCASCHDTGEQGANRSSITWTDSSTVADKDTRAKINILILHDVENATNLQNQTPVMCGSCHEAGASALISNHQSNSSVPSLSKALHSRHAFISQSSSTGDACYACHPGQDTRCLRGAMGSSEEIVCEDCHGDMNTVASSTRTPWVDLPRCESCHTGDAVDNDGAIRRTNAFDNSTLHTSSNSRFSESSDTLFKDSLGHGGVACRGCHGSPHAIWPSLKENDNLISETQQGHAGTLSECSICHSSLELTTNGPHGMHNVNDSRWADEHEDFYEANPNSCKSCHGTDLKGTVLSRTADARVYHTEEGTFSAAKGQMISCSLCHGNPSRGSSHDDDDD
ncbi:MAG: hypothetical protein HQL54_05205 [Magnetococcales bacterium]|nr:hypothetical protein [Magnetococcales bacterium]